MARQQSHIPVGVKVSAVLLLVAFFVQAYMAAKRDSVTLDETTHLPLGLYVLYTNDHSLDPINPTLLGMIAAIPLTIDPPEFPYQSNKDLGHWGLGYLLMKHNVKNYHDIFVRGRVMIIMLALVLGWLVYLWATRLYGWQAGLVALFLFSFSPSMLAHGHLVTLDLAGALGFTATMFATWWVLEGPGYGRAVLLGATMGVATLLKLSGVVLIAAVVVCMTVKVITERRNHDRVFVKHWIGLLATIALASIFIINAGYAFQGFFFPLGQMNLIKGGMLSALGERLPWLRLPLPLPFVEGVDQVLNIGKGHEPSYFLAGELSSEGWWYYHLAAFVFKTPLSLLVISVVSFFFWFAGRSTGRRDYCLFVPILLLFVSNTLFNSMYIGVRHVLPVYPLLFIAVSPLVAKGLYGFFAHSRDLPSMVKAMLSVILVGWFAIGSLSVAPRYLQYFNEVSGGPSGGHELLIDSNIDWGQDLIRLREYMDEKGYEYVNLAYFGRVDPAVYNIPFAPLEDANAQGPVVVSASFLMGRPYFWYKQGRMRWIRPNTYTWLQEYEHMDRVGAMFVYDLSKEKGL